MQPRISGSASIVKSMTSTAPQPPENAGPAGVRLWRSVMDEYRLSGADLFVLEQAVVMADELDQLEKLVRASGPLIKDPDGRPMANPASPAAILSVALARLLAAIRVIADTDEDTDPMAGRRPQRRSGVRGTYSLRAAD